MLSQHSASVISISSQEAKVFTPFTYMSMASITYR